MFQVKPFSYPSSLITLLEMHLTLRPLTLIYYDKSLPSCQQVRGGRSFPCCAGRRGAKPLMGPQSTCPERHSWRPRQGKTRTSKARPRATGPLSLALKDEPEAQPGHLLQHSAFPLQKCRLLLKGNGLAGNALLIAGGHPERQAWSWQALLEPWLAPRRLPACAGCPKRLATQTSVSVSRS